MIILSILALVKKFNDPDGTAYVWFAAFVLPVNSSVNPALYTFSTPKVRTQMSKPLIVNVIIIGQAQNSLIRFTLIEYCIVVNKTGLVLSNYCVFKGN